MKITKEMTIDKVVRNYIESTNILLSFSIGA